MTIHEKTSFIPPAHDVSLRVTFECWKADPTLTRPENQDTAAKYWAGGTLPTIPAEDGLRFVDLPRLLEHMVKHCWQRASPSAGAARGRLTIGGVATFERDQVSMTAGRQTAFNKLAVAPNQAARDKAAAMAQAGTHVRQVQPLIPGETVGAASELKKIAHLKGIATDWKTMEQLPRVNGYTFRGDSRAPGLVAKAGGFTPPITRTDAYYVENVIKPTFKSYMKRRYGQDVSDADFTKAINQAAPANSAERHVLSNYFVWRVMVQNEAFHVGRMLADEALKGYISTSRAVLVARGFAKENGWVYLTRVRGGFLVPDKGATTWTQIFGEQEIALPGKLDWDDVFGFRHVDDQRRLVGPIYFRKGFAAHRIAFAQAYDLLSGKPQGGAASASH
jgi:hypothetical protein